MAAPRRIGRYLLFEAFARGGMGSVHFGRVTGPVGFSRVVAIKRHHPHVAKEPEFVSMLIDEARLAGRIRHPNVVPVIDVVALPGELLLVMDYVAGLSLARLWLAAEEHSESVPVNIAAAILVGALQGLNAAHETRDERGETLGIVHRDVSPQNVLVGADGLTRVTDFGIAHARERLSFTRTTDIKGKLEYMSREQIRRERVDARSDVYSASVVFWETLTGDRLYAGDDATSMVSRMESGAYGAPSVYSKEVPPELDALVLRGLSPSAADRFGSAREMAVAIEGACDVASQLEVAEWVCRIAGRDLDIRSARISAIEGWVESSSSPSPAEETLGDEIPPTPLTRPIDEPAPVVVERRGTPTFTASYAGGEASEITTPIDSSDPEVISTPDPELPISSPSLRLEVPTVRAIPARPPALAQPLERMALMIPILALVGGLLVVVAVALARALNHPTPSVEAQQPVEVPTVASPPTPEPPPPELTVEPPVAVDLPASSSAPPEPSKIPATPHVSVPKPPRPKPTPGCNPPFRVDKDGVRIPKPECFSKK